MDFKRSGKERIVSKIIIAQQMHEDNIFSLEARAGALYSQKQSI